MLPQYPQMEQDPYYTAQYQRLAQLERQQSQQPQFRSPYDMYSSSNQSNYLKDSSNQSNYLKGRPVVSIDEARAAQIDLDGSLFIFTDIGNHKIYTKQINLDGIAVLKTYSLVEEDTSSNDFVTRTELEKIISTLRDELSQSHAERTVEKHESINEQQLGTAKKAVREQPAF